nr:d-amino-acid oxidase [Quercus suber]
MVLQEAGYQVLVIAAHSPGDSSIRYTSPWAGAQWRTHATPAEPMLCDWDVQTYNYWVDVIAEENARPELPRAGLKMYESSLFWDGDIPEDLWWARHVKNFRHLSPSEEAISSINRHGPVDAAPIRAGVSFEAMTMDAPRYLIYLYGKAAKLGVKFVKAELPDDGGFDRALQAARDLAAINGMPSVHCFVNSTGIGARRLCSDAKVEPFRGQTVLVKGEAVAARTRFGDGYSSYCIPRPGSGTTILGGTREKGNWSAEVDASTTSLILERCRPMVPELRTGADGGFEVISVQCGLRPGRRGGPRMEKERVAGKLVVHAYGHAGAGYQNSIGSARLTLKMVHEGLSDDVVAKL